MGKLLRIDQRAMRRGTTAKEVVSAIPPGGFWPSFVGMLNELSPAVQTLTACAVDNRELIIAREPMQSSAKGTVLVAGPVIVPNAAEPLPVVMMLQPRHVGSAQLADGMRNGSLGVERPITKGLFIHVQGGVL